MRVIPVLDSGVEKEPDDPGPRARLRGSRGSELEALAPGDRLVRFRGSPHERDMGYRRHLVRQEATLVGPVSGARVKVETESGPEHWSREDVLDAAAQALSEEHARRERVAALGAPAAEVQIEGEAMIAAGAKPLDVSRWMLREHGCDWRLIALLTATEGQTRASRPIAGRAFFGDEVPTENAINKSISRARAFRVADERGTPEDHENPGALGGRTLPPKWSRARERWLRPRHEARREAPWVGQAIEDADRALILRRADVIRRAKRQRRRIQAAVEWAMRGADEVASAH